LGWPQRGPLQVFSFYRGNIWSLDGVGYTSPQNKGETCMVQEPSHVKQLSPIHVCKIGLTLSVKLHKLLLTPEVYISVNDVFCSVNIMCVLLFAKSNLCGPFERMIQY
jgi:hypothetical protein